MARTVFLMSLLSVVVSCSDVPSAGWGGTVDTLANGRVLVQSGRSRIWDSLSTWRIVEELRIGSIDGTGPDVFGAVSGLEVDPDGRIWVLDRTAAELRVFAPNGSHEMTVGRRGAGPGELRDPIGIVLHPGGQVWVVDPSNARYAVFDSAGNFITTHVRRIAGYTVPWRGGFDLQNRLLEVSTVLVGSAYRSAIIRQSESAELVDTLLVPQYDSSGFEWTNPQKTVMANVPYAPSLVWTFDTTLTIWSGVSTDYRIYKSAAMGDTQSVISRAYDPIPVSGAERDSALARMTWFTNQGGHVDASMIPSRKPVFDRIELDGDGHLWITVPSAMGQSGTRFDIFDPVGRYLGEVRAPMNLRRGLLFRNDRIYAVTSDSLGVSYVVRLNVVRGEGSPATNQRP